MTPKIDLAEINGIVADIMMDYEDAVKDNEPLTERSWGYETGQIFTHETAKQIASALEALPKLVEALRKVQQDWAETENTKDPDCDGYEALQLISEALTLFETSNH